MPKKEHIVKKLEINIKIKDKDDVYISLDFNEDKGYTKEDIKRFFDSMYELLEI